MKSKTPALREDVEAVLAAMKSRLKKLRNQPSFPPDVLDGMAIDADILERALHR